MQGRRFGVGSRGRGRGRVRGDARQSSRSPIRSKVKERRSVYRKKPISPHHLSHRSLGTVADRQAWRQAPRRSLSPLTNRPLRSPIHMRSPSFEQRRGRTLFDDEGFDLRGRYMLPDHPNELIDQNAPLKPTRTMNDKNLAGPSSLVQESLFLDDGSKRTFYTLPQESRHLYDSAGGSLNIGMSRYDQHLGDPYEDKGKEKHYSKDVSFQVMPPAQARPIVSAPSLGFSSDADSLRMYGDRGVVGKFSDAPLEYNDTLDYNGYNQAHLSDQLRRGPLSPPVREEPLDYRYEERARRERDDYDRYQKSVYDSRGEFRDAKHSSFLGFAGGRVDKVDSYHKKFGEGSSWDDHQHSFQRDATMDFCDLKGVQKDYVGGSGSGYAGFGLKASRDLELPPLEERYHIEGDVSPVTYRERRSSPLLVHRPLDMFTHGASAFRPKLRLDDDFPTLDMSPERLHRRNYVTTDDLKRRNVHRRLQSPIHDDEMWSHEEHRPTERRQFLSPEGHAIGHSQKKRLHSHKLSRNEGWGKSSDSSACVDDGRGIGLKKRLRSDPSDAHGPLSLERGKELFRPHKVWRRVQEDRNNGLNATDDDILDDSTRRVNNEPLEDSEEFKQQVHKAFLHFSKLLNESSHQQKRYRDDQKKSGKLLCCVCGRLSKEFVDVHSMLMHSYHSHKVGLRTEHLGFHKALCLLNGWNWLVVPDASNAYRRRPPSEIKTLKEDLILWPPIVLIQNSSIGNKSSNGPRIVSIEKMEEILKEMGFGVGKTKVSRGKPANQSVLLVKFQPTFSGLQEAERLHKYFADNSRGRQELKQIASSNGEAQRVVEKNEDLLYGFMAVAEDLDKLDPEIKKRSLVKSKRDIQAIADAPLKID